MLQQQSLGLEAFMHGLMPRRNACRGANADVVCDHGSLSRQHAQLCYKPATRQWLVMDLGSTHGTFVDGQRVTKVLCDEHEHCCVC